MHVAPSEGTPRDVAGPVLEMLFPESTPSRIPMATITGTNGKTTTARMLAHIMKLAGFTVGLSSTDGVYIDGRLTVEGDMTGPVSAGMILRDPSVDAAVLETARGGMLRRGLGFSHCDVAACLNVTADHLGLRGIETVEELAQVKRVPIETATDTAVLNADDEHCLRMADYTEAKHLCYVTMNPGHNLVKEHIRAGGRAVVLEEGFNGHMITIYDSGNHIPLLWTHLIPATLEGRALHNVQNAMFAAAIAFSLDVSLENIRHGLRTFDTTFFQAPGRMNLYSEHPFKVILDYGHNPAAVKAMCELVDRFDIDGRKVVVLSAPGDRRDQDIEEIGRISAGHFDHYILRTDDNARGRDRDEVPGMLRKVLLNSGVAKKHIETIIEETEAVETALSIARPGDLVFIFGDNIKRCWKQIIYFNSGEKTVQDEKPAPVILPPTELGDFSLDAIEIIRDERGVRIARDPEESD
jgi:cyanophycin synthetase